MGIRFYKPTTPGRRGGSVSDFAEITDRKKKPEKSLLTPAKKRVGRNFQGVICTRFRGGGHKQMYRIIDFKRNKDNVWATVVSIEYDPNRTPRIALLQYEDGTKTYILAPEGLKAGDRLLSGDAAEPRVGNAMSLRKIPLGMNIHNLELQPGRGGQMCRSAGTSATLERPRRQMGADHASFRRSPPRQRRLPRDHRLDRQRRAHERQPGQGRPQTLDGRKPHNRGTSMNPGEPSDGRRRRPHRRRTPSLQPDGRVGQGGQDAQEDGNRRTRRSFGVGGLARIMRRNSGRHLAMRARYQYNFGFLLVAEM